MTYEGFDFKHPDYTAVSSSALTFTTIRKLIRSAFLLLRFITATTSPILLMTGAARLIRAIPIGICLD